MRQLAGFLEDLEVQEHCKRILKTADDLSRIRVVLENIERTGNRTLIEELRQFCDTRLWEQDSAVARALVGAIEATKELDLILILEKIEKSGSLNDETMKFTKQVKHDLGGSFRSAVEQEAKQLKVRGLTRPNNERSLYRKFGFLLDPNHVQQVMESLYSVKIKARRRNQ